MPASPNASDVLAWVLSRYPVAPQDPGAWQFLGNAGGFSGARLWRTGRNDRLCSAGSWCLRRWPATHPSPERLKRIHAALQWARQQGLPFLAYPQLTVDSCSFVSDRSGYLWELSPWLAGQADFRASPSPQRLENAMAALSQLYQIWQSFPHSGARPGSAGANQQPAQPVRERLQLLGRYSPDFLASLDLAISQFPAGSSVRIARELLRRFREELPALRARLEAAQSARVPHQFCLRDIGHDHLLFEGANLTGIIDYGAARESCVAADLARLLPSLLHGTESGLRSEWVNMALARFGACRPLTMAEIRLLPVLDRSGVLLGAMNWVCWLFAEHRQFDDPSLVEVRMRELLERLDEPALAADL